MEILILYLLLVNAAAFAFMLEDKRRARRNAWRIPESTLLAIAAIGGSLGILLGMYAFRHKTRHPKFTVGVPVLLVLNFVVFSGILYLLYLF